MEISGRIKVMMDLQTFDSGFKKKEFVITTQEQYPQDVKFDLVNDKIALIDQFQVGEPIKVFFNIRGNEYNGRYFVNLQAWKLEKQTEEAPEMPPLPTQLDPIIPDDSEDDLPF